MKRTKEEALITRQNLLSAALKVFSKRGYSATRLEDIALEAGVTRGAIYHHFGGKEELFTELVIDRSSDVNQLAAEILSEGGSPAQTLRELLVRLFEYGEEDEDYRAMLEIATDKVEFTGDLEDFSRTIIRGRRALIRLLANLIRDGVEAGEFRTDLSVKDAAIAVAGFLNGVGLLWVQDPDSFSIRRRSEAMVDVMMEGMLA